MIIILGELLNAEPFVQIIELGNNSINYRINGLLKEVKNILSTTSRLNQEILDILHGNGIEIVSPSFMNQRRLNNQNKIIPLKADKVAIVQKSKPEEIVFDKAAKAEEREKIKQEIKDEIKILEEQSKNSNGEDKKKIADAIDNKRTLLDVIEKQENDQ